MANGDAGAAAGIPKIAATDSRSLGYDNINRLSDEIVTRAKRTGVDIDIWVQATAPAHKAGRVWIKA